MTNFEIFKYGFLFMAGVYTAKSVYVFVNAFISSMFSELRKQISIMKGVEMSEQTAPRKPFGKPPKQKIGFDPTRF